MDRLHLSPDAPFGGLTLGHLVRRHAAACVLAVAWLSGHAGAAWSQPRDTPGQIQQGVQVASGRIAGRVVTADTGRPVQRARVRLNAPELAGGRGALTDADGVFEFPELPAGRYTLAVSKSGFVTIAYGQRRPLQPGTPLQLSDGQQLRGIELRLPRGSVIAGQVVDEAGDPLPGASVRVLAYRYAQGNRQLVPAGGATTDDRGAYRVWGLNPGEYYVSAIARNFDVGGPGRGGPPGPPAGGGRGGRRTGPGAPGVGGVSLPDPDDAPEQTGYAPTYFPGVESVAEARPVTVGLGAEALDVSFGVLLVRTSRVSGRVVGEDGAPVSTGNVLLVREGQAIGRPGPGAGYNSRIQWDGTFAMANVAPGRYLLRVRGDDWDVPQFATMPLTVTGGEMSGLNVILLPGATVAGTVTFQRSQGLPPDPTQFRVGAPGVDGFSLGPPQTVRVDKDGRFEIQGVAAGAHWLRTQAPRGWAVKSIVADGRDVTDTPVDLRSGQRLTGVAITFTDRLSELSGLVRDGTGTPVTAFTVLAFPDDASLWVPQSRFVMTARPDQTGRYEMRGLPPGDYLLAVVDPSEANEWFEPAFLEQQRAGATRVSLAEGAVRTQNVTIGR